jgi:hypothetical protein
MHRERSSGYFSRCAVNAATLGDFEFGCHKGDNFAIRPVKRAAYYGRITAKLN